MKKNLFSTLIALFSVNILLAQIAVFTPVKVEKNDIEQFLNVKKVEILDWSFFYPDGLKIERAENQIRGGRRNKCPDFMYEQGRQIEQAKRRLCTLLHLMEHE